jgi:hypothetical protein
MTWNLGVIFYTTISLGKLVRKTREIKYCLKIRQNLSFLSQGCKEDWRDGKENYMEIKDLPYNFSSGPRWQGFCNIDLLCFCA